MKKPIPTNQTTSTNNESSNLQSLNVDTSIGRKDQSVDFPYIKTPKTISTNKKPTKKVHALDIYIIFCFVCIIIYTVVHTIIFYKTGIEATVLDALFYGVFGGEVLLCALLKRLKLKQEFELTKEQSADSNILSEDRYEE